MAIVGKGGSIVCANAQTGVKSWSINEVADALDCTDFDSSGKREYLAGLTAWSGGFTANYSTVNTLAVGGTAVAFKGRLGSTTAGRLLHGSIIITGRSIGNPVDGVCPMDYTFQGTGKLSSTST